MQGGETSPAHASKRMCKPLAIKSKHDMSVSLPRRPASTHVSNNLSRIVSANRIISKTPSDNSQLNMAGDAHLIQRNGPSVDWTFQARNLGSDHTNAQLWSSEASDTPLISHHVEASLRTFFQNRAAQFTTGPSGSSSPSLMAISPNPCSEPYPQPPAVFSLLPSKKPPQSDSDPQALIKHDIMGQPNHGLADNDEMGQIKYDGAN